MYYFFPVNQEIKVKVKIDDYEKAKYQIAEP
jgi:hypothetical protein